MNLPQGLPDARTAQRLLDVISQLEHALKNARHINHAAASDVDARMSNLHFENQRLKETRKQAAERLDVLLQGLKDQLAAQPQPAAEGDGT